MTTRTGSERDAFWESEVYSRSSPDEDMQRLARIVENAYKGPYNGRIAKGQPPTEQETALWFIANQASTTILEPGEGDLVAIFLHRSDPPLAKVAGIFQSDLANETAEAYGGEWREIRCLAEANISHRSIGAYNILCFYRCLLSMSSKIKVNQLVLAASRTDFAIYERRLKRTIKYANEAMHKRLVKLHGRDYVVCDGKPYLRVGNHNGEPVRLEYYVGIIPNVKVAMEVLSREINIRSMSYVFGQRISSADPRNSLTRTI